MNHPNLSPALNLLLEAGHRPESSLDLRKVNIGNVIAVTFGTSPQENIIIFRIDKPAGLEVSGATAATGRIFDLYVQPDKVSSFRKAGIGDHPVGQKCALVGACTRNPSSPLGMTMLQFHAIVLGRHLYWTMEAREEVAWLYREVVTDVKLITGLN